MEIEKEIEFLENMDKYFHDLENKIREENAELCNREAETQDYLHELEISKLNGVEIIKVAKRLIKARKNRRRNKDNLLKYSTIKPLCDIYYKKGISAEVKQTIENLKTLKRNNENRKYTVRVAEGLKIGDSDEIPQ